MQFVRGRLQFQDRAISTDPGTRAGCWLCTIDTYTESAILTPSSSILVQTSSSASTSRSTPTTDVTEASARSTGRPSNPTRKMSGLGKSICPETAR